MQIVIAGSPIITEPIHPSIGDRATLVRSHIEQVAKYGPGVTTLRIRVAQGIEFICCQASM
ncbi:hypothetical protein B0G81_2374 [Paraburkholderia sp. BL6665CI2N2]|uniref:hypothetical protein n=1 Tax=Paraburkholderia sp. BL6665CI2N2 TaxID=1938806 RepID=UPI0010662AE8|nr:hypothetical protein [Paraburkholderia sp. BL6665CI2N2]TDY22091.1 hypothetical protein B0G81_2374 [Paraburkholderia sp. BL6665CI2N2]